MDRDYQINSGTFSPFLDLNQSHLSNFKLGFGQPEYDSINDSYNASYSVEFDLIHELINRSEHPCVRVNELSIEIFSTEYDIRDKILNFCSENFAKKYRNDIKFNQYTIEPKELYVYTHHFNLTDIVSGEFIIHTLYIYKNPIGFYYDTYIKQYFHIDKINTTITVQGDEFTLYKDDFSEKFLNSIEIVDSSQIYHTYSQREVNKLERFLNYIGKTETDTILAK